VQPDSTASDTVTFTGGVVTPPPPGGGGGGGRVIEPLPEEEEEEIEEPYAFAINIEILPKYKEILLDEDSVVAEIEISSIGIEKQIKEAEFEYFIENSQGRIISIEKERLDIDTKTKLLRDIEIPEGTKIGEYWFVAEIEYQTVGAVDKDIFTIVETKVAAPLGEFPRINLLTLIIILLVIILILIILRIFLKKRKSSPILYHYRKQRPSRFKREKIMKRFFSNIKQKGPSIKRIQPRDDKTAELKGLFSKVKKYSSSSHEGKSLIKRPEKKHGKTSKEKEDLKKLVRYIKDEV